MSRVVSTEVTLTTGKKVKVYYINEAFRRELERLLDTDRPTIFKHLVALTERSPRYTGARLTLLEQVLRDSIYKLLFLEIRNLVLDKEKSFHKFEITHSEEITPFYWDLKEEVFNNLVAAKLIVYRGSGWFRRGSNEMPTKM